MVTVSYPGVYIEEVPSGVRTITGVATSIAAFVGYTRIGPVNRAVKIFNFGDFEREFGGLDRDSDLSYAVYHFFQNGGHEAWIVRVARDAARAGLTLCADVSGSTPALRVEALTEGEWGNTLRLEVDYDTVNPASLFNLTVTEYRESNGMVRAFRSETHRNLSMNSYHTSYAVDVVRANSNLIRLARVFDLTALGSGWSASGDLGALDWSGLNDDTRRLAITMNGDGPYEFDLFDPGGGISDLAGLAASIRARVQALSGDDAFRDFTCVQDGNGIRATSGEAGERSAVHFSNAGIRNAARLLRLGVANGGREVTAAAAMRPAQTGTILSYNLNQLDFGGLPDDLTASVEISWRDSVAATVSVPVWTAVNKPGNPQALRTRFQAALNDAARAELRGAAATIIDNQLRVVAGGTDPNARLNFPGLGIPVEQNVARYALGVGLTLGAQTAPISGNNGVPPESADLRGSRADKTGFYALENVDLFNLLLFPNISNSTVLTPALDYCEEKRAFLLLDLPVGIDTLPEAVDWLEGDGRTLRHKNAAAYFPRIEAPDPLQNSRTQGFASSGAIAGLYARTDNERGVWKAPAGIDAALRGVTRLAYTLSDQENGVLNPLGLNALRSFPIYGHIVWGARTLYGADVQASEWKYIPVRRLALFIEESLYRGTKWVVFEPNDEPLWAQIRLNVGVFMTGLFRQGAFQGTTPNQAFFVKCDGETTTQADRNLGIVNIEVGFAPLKPAEFVIIRIQQMAGELG